MHTPDTCLYLFILKRSLILVQILLRWHTFLWFILFIMHLGTVKEAVIKDGKDPRALELDFMSHNIFSRFASLITEHILHPT